MPALIYSAVLGRFGVLIPIEISPTEVLPYPYCAGCGEIEVEDEDRLCPECAAEQAGCERYHQSRED